MTEQLAGAVTDVAPPPAEAEPTPPWVASTEAVVIEPTSATEQTQSPERVDQGQESPPTAAEDIVTLKRDEYRRLMGTVGGLSSLQQQFQGLKAENLELKKQLEEWNKFRQQQEQQQQQTAIQSTLEQLIAQARDHIASQIGITEEEFERAIAPIIQPLAQRALEIEREKQQLEQSYLQAREQQARLAGIEWLRQASDVVIKEVADDFRALGVQVELTHQDLAAVGATVERVRDIDHLRLLAREAAFRKARGNGQSAQAQPAPQSNMSSLAAATGLPNGPWGLAPSGPSVGALSPRMLRQQYAAGEITLEQFREGMAKAPKEERLLVPALFR